MPRLSSAERRLKSRLDALLAGMNARSHRDADPVSFVHRYAEPDDREIVGLVASALAFGNVVAVRASVARALERLGPSPARTVAELDRDDLSRLLAGFVHRIYRGPHLAAVLANAAAIRRRDGTIGRSLRRRLDASGSFREALSDLAADLRGPLCDRGIAHLVPDPRAGSACKRLLLYARWMSRPADGVDVGLWPVPPSRLVIPVDTHVHRIAQNLRLTARRDASWRTAEEITAALRRFDADDPVKYDFALCHLGVSRECPSRREAVKCERCVLRTVCHHWQVDRG